jgi:RNA polymerase sigma factor (sigma-70 family)
VTRDMDAFVTQAYPTVLRRLTGLLGDPTAAQDVAQEVFIRLHSSEHLPLAHYLPSWLRKVTFNAAMNWRREEKTRTRYQDAYGRATELQVSPLTLGPRRARLLTSLAGLQSGPREMLMLYYVEGLNIDELAVVLSIGGSAVKMRLKRARDDLRDLYRQGGHSPLLTPDVG